MHSSASLNTWFPCVFTCMWCLHPDSSVGKESTCKAGDPYLVPGSARSTGEGIGYPLQYSWAFPVAKLVKNLPAMRETWIHFLAWEDLFSSFLLCAIRVVSSSFLLATFIPACASSSPQFLMMYSAYKLNKQGENIQL